MPGPILNLDAAEGFPMAPEGGSETFGAFMTARLRQVNRVGEGLGYREGEA